jgi:V/A-type H+-transporting ATPase subunit E
MAGAEKLINKIIGDAQAEAEKLWQDAEDKRKAMRGELNSELEKQASQMESDAAAASLEKKRRLSAVYDLEYRKQLLAAKQEMMGKARALALQKLQALGDADYTALMKKRLLACAVSGEGSIVVSKSEKRLNNAFLADVNGELKKTAGAAVTFAAEKRNMSGGFIYISGGMEINVSLEALLAEAWEDSETEVAAILFE